MGNLPSSHGAAIGFELAAIAGLFFAGRRLPRASPGVTSGS